MIIIFLWTDDKNDRKSQEALKELENIDSEADEEMLPLVRIDDKELAEEYGFETELPVLVYFEKRIPSVYQGIYRHQTVFNFST